MGELNVDKSMSRQVDITDKSEESGETSIVEPDENANVEFKFEAGTTKEEADQFVADVKQAAQSNENIMQLILNGAAEDKDGLYTIQLGDLKSKEGKDNIAGLGAVGGNKFSIDSNYEKWKGDFFEHTLVHEMGHNQGFTHPKDKPEETAKHNEWIDSVLNDQGFIQPEYGAEEAQTATSDNPYTYTEYTGPITEVVDTHADIRASKPQGSS